MQFHQRRLNSLLAKTLPPAAIGFGENPIAALRSVVTLSEAKELMFLCFCCRRPQDNMYMPAERHRVRLTPY
jgi:hypothetical protein